MLRFYGATFTAVVSNLERATAIVSLSVTDDDWKRDIFLTNVADFEKELKGLPVSNSLKEQASRFKVKADAGESVEVLVARLEELRNNLIHELTEHLFLCVPSADKWLFLEPEKNYWTVEVCDAFPDARQDLRECARCLALGMWTASVFHGMRSVQHGLHRLADRLGVTFTRDIDVLNWNEILQGIEKKLKEMANQPKTAARDAELQFASSASSHFFGIKEAWRNYVMHGRSTYDEPQARTVAANVRSILKALA